VESVGYGQIYRFREKKVYKGGPKAYNNRNFLVTISGPPNAEDCVW